MNGYDVTMMLMQAEQSALGAVFRDCMRGIAAQRLPASGSRPRVALSSGRTKASVGQSKWRCKKYFDKRCLLGYTDVGVAEARRPSVVLTIRGTSPDLNCRYCCLAAAVARRLWALRNIR